MGFLRAAKNPAGIIDSVQVPAIIRRADSTTELVSPSVAKSRNFPN